MLAGELYRSTDKELVADRRRVQIILARYNSGARSVVGAGAVVVRDVPPDAVVVGNPARVVRTLTK